MLTIIVVVIVITLTMCISLVVVSTIRLVAKKEGYSSIIDFTAGKNDTLESYNGYAFDSKHDEQEYLCNSRLCDSTPSLQERPHSIYNPKNFYTF